MPASWMGPLLVTENNWLEADGLVGLKQLAMLTSAPLAKVPWTVAQRLGLVDHLSWDWAPTGPVGVAELEAEEAEVGVEDELEVGPDPLSTYQTDISLHHNYTMELLWDDNVCTHSGWCYPWCTGRSEVRCRLRRGIGFRQ